MPPAQTPPETSRADWLPWFLAIFGAGCAVFVLLKGVLPARTANAHLVERVARLESAAQSASSERASLERAKGHLLEQYTSAQAQISDVAKEQERQRQTQETARKDMNATFADQLSTGDLWLEQRAQDEAPVGNAEAGKANPPEGTGQLVIGIRDRVLFNGERGEVTWKGRKFLKALAENLKHLPADQVYEIGGHFDPAAIGRAERGRAESSRSAESRVRSSWELSAKRAASVARYLEEECGISGSQLVAAGFSRYRPAADAARSRRIEIVLRRHEPQKI